MMQQQIMIGIEFGGEMQLNIGNDSVRPALPNEDKMDIEQIEDMLLAFNSSHPAERVEGLTALAKFLYDLQKPEPEKDAKT